MKVYWTGIILSMACTIATVPTLALAQVEELVDAPTAAAMEVQSIRPEPVYTPPTSKEKAANYAWDTFGPLPLVTAGGTAGIGQWNNSTPEWGQGAQGYGRRIGSEFGMAATTSTTRYVLSEALHEDALYYRCECSGFMRRLGHAAISTVTARHGQSGRRAFSLAALVAPYAGSSAAVYGWYPDRYGAKDSFRIGNYNLLALVGGNVAMEFLYSGPRSLLSRVHLTSRRGSSDPGPNH